MRLKQVLSLISALLLAACAPGPEEPASHAGQTLTPALPYGRGYEPGLSPGYVPPPSSPTSPDAYSLAPGVGLGVYQPDWVRRGRDRRDGELRREREMREGLNRDRRRQDYERQDLDHRRYERTLGRYY